MAKKKPTARKPRRRASDPPPESAGQAVRRVLLTLLAGVIILVGGLYLFAGTEGFRSMIESHALTSLELPLEIGRSRARLDGTLELGDIRIDVGLDFAVREGSRTIGAGNITELR